MNIYDGEDNRISRVTTDKVSKLIEEKRIDTLTIEDLDKVILEEDLESGYERLRNQLNMKTCSDVEVNKYAYVSEYDYVNNIIKENEEVIEIYRNN